ncbi:MAG: hypothetical protein OXE77_11895 [Flavobacteriaceae bacterium]|nr:hypothetical protein [Flavobacteriaceae bacterium]MCY4298044.1 hypothetical protein [Flavobacteriaceae bacterium]
MEKVTNKQILDAVHSNTEKLNSNTEKLNVVNDKNVEVLKRLENIENRVYGMNDKITSNGKDIYWIKRIGIFMVTVLGGLWTTLFINKGS